MFFYDIFIMPIFWYVNFYYILSNDSDYESANLNAVMFTKCSMLIFRIAISDGHQQKQNLILNQTVFRFLKCPFNSKLSFFSKEFCRLDLSAV